MKILQICPHYVPAYSLGGPLQVAHNLGKALHQQGNEVTVVTTNIASEHHDLDVAIDQPIDVDGITVYYEPTTLLRFFGFSYSLYRRTKILCNWADVVFVHFHYQFSNLVGSTLARKMNKPYVIFAHGSFNKWGIERKSSIKKKIYLNIFERKNLAHASFIAFNAHEERELSLFSEIGQVVPSGINPRDFSELPPRGYWRKKIPELNNKVCFLYLGRLNTRQKGLDLLVPAFARLLHQEPNISLILAGPDERGGEEEIKNMVRELGIEQAVYFTGLVNKENKLAILNDSDVFVLSSPSEGTSIALLEAMYMGLPVVTTDRVGLSHRIRKENCGLVVNRHIDQLAEAMRTMMDDAMRREMGGRARDLVEAEFTWDSIATALNDKIKELARTC